MHKILNSYIFTPEMPDKSKYKHAKTPKSRKIVPNSKARWRSGLNELSVREKYPDEKGEEWTPDTPPPKEWNFRD